MIRKILCKKCEVESKLLFPNESPYPAEHIKFVPGIIKRACFCDNCDKRIHTKEEVCAFSIFTNEGEIPYFEWEDEYLTLKEDENSN